MPNRSRRRFLLLASIIALLPALFLQPAAQRLLSLTSHARPVVDNRDHLYVLDGWGDVHPVGSAPRLTTTASWPHRDEAQSLALFPDATGGYVMDANGGIHAVGDAPRIQPGAYWDGLNFARAIEMAPWSSAERPAGWVMNGYGQLYPFGGAPEVGGFTYWPGTDSARSFVVLPASTPSAVMGYVLDNLGGFHPFGGAPSVSGNPTWPHKDFARGFALVPGAPGEGYTLDGSGGIHPWGGAPSVADAPLWPGQDVADSIVMWTSAPAGSPGGWVLDRHGDVRAFGSAPALTPSATWPGWDIARGFNGGGGSFERRYVDPEVISDGWGSYYNQRDSRWGAQPVGPSAEAVWQIGCLLSDLAMVYTHFGFHNVTPGTVAAHASWFGGGGEIYNSALNIPGHTTIVSWHPSWAWIRGYLSAGYPVIVGMDLPTGGTHFVTLTGLDGPNDYWTNDPWEQNAHHVTFSGDWVTRGPVYEAIAFV
ncbi:MAG TPA: papain-like cysteine protease family protein [Candidatus Dormibacteraeota bacterium]|nr:papain-like cysteine protease family protein [Candidatus Dormibacteraeota bacterium]